MNSELIPALDLSVVAVNENSSSQNQKPDNNETVTFNLNTEALDQSVVASDENSNNQHGKEENDETEALNLYLIELTKVFRRGIAMGFLVKRGENYQWNLEGE